MIPMRPERGIYKMVKNRGKDDEKISYGQFHVLLKKSGDQWKILMDYDSNENGTIGEDDYNRAFAMDDFTKFGK